jgi:aminoglycoside phosphotransferase (APT) family kinase protein
VTSVEGAAPAVVGPYLATALADPAWSEATVTLIAGGKSNLTYRVDSPAGSVVLRRPPLGHVLPTAHDMGREYRVMSALEGTAVPVPRMRHFCSDPEVLGQPFYVMDLVEGYVVRQRFPAGYADTEPERQQVCERLVDVLGALHQVDIEAVGLADFGRPDGYMARQVARWSKQWDASRLDGMEALDALAAELTRQLPETQRHTVVHGDYRLDNTVLDPDDVGRVAAVLDWEMSTLGDPLADLGWLLYFWLDPGDEMFRGPGGGAVTHLDGFPRRADLLQRYAERSGRDVRAVDWYAAMAGWKIAIIMEGSYRRYLGGVTDHPTFARLEEGVPALARRAAMAMRGEFQT